jgi:hypothetical protein
MARAACRHPCLRRQRAGRVATARALISGAKAPEVIHESPGGVPRGFLVIPDAVYAISTTTFPICPPPSRCANASTARSNG